MKKSKAMEMLKEETKEEKIVKLKELIKNRDQEGLKAFAKTEMYKDEEGQKIFAEKEKIAKNAEILNKDEPPEIIPPVLREPKIKIKESPKGNTKKEKIIMRPTPDQIHILVHTVAIGATTILNKEEVTKEEDESFSKVLYDVGDSLGWWNSIDFLPYLILLFAGVDLSITIMKKPSKVKRQLQRQELITEKIERQPNEKPNVLFDEVNEDALMDKLGGNKIYAAKTTGQETE